MEPRDTDHMGLAPDVPDGIIDDEHAHKSLSPQHTYELLHYAKIAGANEAAVAELLFWHDVINRELPEDEQDPFILQFVVRCLRLTSSIGGTGRKELVQALISQSKGDPWLAEEGLRMVYDDDNDNPKRLLKRLQRRGLRVRE